VEPHTILLVDDYPANLLALEAALQPLEERLVKASSGAEALKFLLADRCSLIVLDVNMPGQDGFETAALIRSRPRTRDIPILFMTASGGPQRAREASAYGAADYIVRPIDTEVLRTKVRALLDMCERAEGLERQLARSAEQERTQLAGERRLERRYRSLVEATGQIVWSANASGVVVEDSPSWRAFTGQTLGQWLGHGRLHAVHPEDRARASRAWRQAVAGERRYEAEFRLRRGDGSYAEVLTRAVPLRDDDGSVLEWLGTSIDLTEHKRAERRSAFAAQILADAGRILGSSLEADATLTSIAQLAVPLFADWCAVHLRETSGAIRLLAVAGAAERHPVDPSIIPGAAAALRSGRTEWSQPDAQAPPAGLLSYVAVPFSARGEVLGALTLVTTDRSGRRYDADDVRLAEELADRVGSALDNASLYQRAQEAVRVRDDFLSIASHELRTPLTPLRLQIQILRRLLEGGEPPAREKLAQSLETLERQTERLSRLVNDLLDVSRIAAGKVTLHREAVDLAEVAREVVERYAAGSASRIAVEAQSAVGSWDRARLEQVATNLVVNAIKYGEGKPIDVVVKRHDGCALLMVRDRGIGIAPGDAARIFGRFERAASASAYGGLGLGLYIAQQIAAAHGGRISVHSAPGNGATFEVELPFGER
jgi:PAS domain S-box-containing protein